MRKTVLLLLFALLLPLAPAAGADTDLLESKVRHALSKAAAQITSEGEDYPDHAARLAFALEIAEDPERWSRRFLGLIVSLYPDSANKCYADTLTGAVNCSNATSQDEVYNQAVAVLGVYLKLRASRAQAVAALEAAPAPVETKAAALRKP
jgi:hypothetical protein